jgi:threonine 3-dehydrogenase
METILVTGANGEVGHGLLKKIKESKVNLITLDLNDLDPNLSNYATTSYKGSVTDRILVEKIFQKNKIDTIFHLAAILSTAGEKNPLLAHQVNVEGTINLLEVALKQKHPLKFIFPSSIAVYGLPNLEIKNKIKKIEENKFLDPITMYGINKLYCEHLGVYYSNHVGSLESEQRLHNIDFRCLRYPGLISADTVPSGGTSDYASEMIHFAAQKKPYECFVRPDSQIPFMAMPDAIDAIVILSKSPKKNLTQNIYNVSGFSVTASQIENIVKKSFPEVKITYKINPARQKIIDSWPKDINDLKARKDWGWKTKFDFKNTFDEYLIPLIGRRYCF